MATAEVTGVYGIQRDEAIQYLVYLDGTSSSEIDGKRFLNLL